MQTRSIEQPDITGENCDLGTREKMPAQYSTRQISQSLVGGSRCRSALRCSTVKLTPKKEVIFTDPHLRGREQLEEEEEEETSRRRKPVRVKKQRGCGWAKQEDGGTKRQDKLAWAGTRASTALWTHWALKQSVCSAEVLLPPPRPMADLIMGKGDPPCDMLVSACRSGQPDAASARILLGGRCK